MSSTALQATARRCFFLHGLMVSGAMFDPLVERLKDGYRMLIPDLRGHGQSGAIGGPYDVATLAADLNAVVADAGFTSAAVLGYSHGGAVAQQLARSRPGFVSRLILCCTYACNISTTRERIECEIFSGLLRILSPGTLAKLLFRPSPPKPTGAIGLTAAQAQWLRSLMAANGAEAMRGGLRGLIRFDSRPWLKKIAAPTLVVAGTDDHAVPRHHFDMLVSNISGARGCLVDRADHTLIWTHTDELANIIRA